MFFQVARMTSLQLVAKEEMVERLLDAAATGDLTQVSTLLSHAPSLINQKGYNGWTALMLASRNGHFHVVEALLSHGYKEPRRNIEEENCSKNTPLSRFKTHCLLSSLFLKSCDKLQVNNSSQTAYDIAKFWGHRHISKLLSWTDDGCQRVLPGSDLQQQENYFSREMLDRLSGKRTDEAWLEAKQSQSDTVYLLFSNLSPMVSGSWEDDKAEVGG